MRSLLFVLTLNAFGADEFFETKIRPVLAKNCYACHATTRMGGLDVSSREGLLKGGEIGPAIVPGRPEDSLLLQSVTHSHERLKMPLGLPRLTDEQISNLADWIKAGAEWPRTAASIPKKTNFTITAEQRGFWSFQPVRKPKIPAVRHAAWARTDIDRLLLQPIEAKGVTLAPPALKRTLLRRAYFDLTGLPPSAEQIEAFERDASPDAFAKVVNQLLDSPRYGERWARYWLDVARYSDDRLESEVDAPYENSFRYRDWVIRAFNEDMPYDRFVKAQIAGDLMGETEKGKYSAGLGFYALRPDTQEDRVDVTGRAFLGLTTGCAQCHNHKFDPIPTTDYYALLGVFASTKNSELPLAADDVVKDYKARAKAVEDKKAEIRDFLYAQAREMGALLASQTARYVTAVRTGEGVEKLDAGTLARWKSYLARERFDHPYLKDWGRDQFDATKFQERVLAVLKERKAVDEENTFRRAEAKKKGPKAAVELTALKAESFYLWRDLFFNDFYGNVFKQEDDGLLYYGPNRGYYESDGTIERFLSGVWKEHLNRLREELAALKSNLPAQYPFLHTIADSDKLKTERVRLGGVEDNQGEEVPRRFLTILAPGLDPQPFTKGAGRLELAEAIADRNNPLTARVMVNRIWTHHFGTGLVRTPSDFGFMGDRPSNAELLDYLAARLVESGWSIKSLHREIMLSSAYRLSSARVAANADLDPDNRLYWRANVRRLDVESLRDSLLAVSNELDLETGGRAQRLTELSNKRRSVYGFVSRRHLDSTLALFDFPNANQTSEKRTVTITPPQQLFFMNGPFVMDRARALAGQAGTVEVLYRRIFGRAPQPAESQLGAQYLTGGKDRLALYAQALLMSNEFAMID